MGLEHCLSPQPAETTCSIGYRQLRIAMTFYACLVWASVGREGGKGGGMEVAVRLSVWVRLHFPLRQLGCIFLRWPAGGVCSALN